MEAGDNRWFYHANPLWTAVLLSPYLGPIPPTLGRLTALVQLELSDNGLNGESNTWGK